MYSEQGTKNERPWSLWYIWKIAHICKLNYKGSAGNMEPVGA